MNLKYFLDRKYELCAILIFFIIFAQLLYLIDYQGGILDEQFYPGVWKYFVTNSDFSPFAFRYHPALSYYINSVFLYFDNNPTWKNTPHSLAYIIENGYDLNYFLFLTRLPIAFVSLLLGFYIYKWAKEIYGKRAALFALFLYGFEPSILAHGSFATTDIVAAAFIFISMYYFWEFFKYPNWKSCLISGVTLALALLSKNTALILIPLVFALLVYKYKFRIFSKVGVKFGLIFFVSIFIIIWTAYGFQVSSVMSQVHSPEKALDFINSKYSGVTKDIVLGLANLPLPATTYITSIGYNIWHSSSGQGNYFLGEIGTHSKWYYFPVAFLIKTPIPLLIVLFIAVAFLLFNKKRKVDEKFLILPAIVYLLFLMFMLSLYIGIRHLLPIYPFLFVIMGGIIYRAKFLKRRRIFNIIILALCIWYIAESLTVFPHDLSYFNEFVGTENAWKLFADTDVDWGQDVKELGKYMSKNNIKTINFVDMLPNVYTRFYIQN